MASKLGDILEKVKVEAPSPGDSSADLVVICGEDVHRLHSALLASKAGFFEAALNAPMVEREEGKINIGGVEPEIFKKVVKFIYEQDLEFDLEDELEGLLDAADHFDFAELKTKVNEMVKDALDEENVMATAGLAELFNAKELLATCIEAVVRLEVRLEAGYVARCPGVALALVEYWREKAMEKARQERMLALRDEMRGVLMDRGVKGAMLEECLVYLNEEPALRQVRKDRAWREEGEDLGLGARGMALALDLARASFELVDALEAKLLESSFEARQELDREIAVEREVEREMREREWLQIQEEEDEEGENGNGAMALNGNGVNGAENGSRKTSGIDEGLYSRQLFVLGM